MSLNPGSVVDLKTSAVERKKKTKDEIRLASISQHFQRFLIALGA